MPRAIWSGAISFGLVNIPVKLYSAVNRKTVRFHQLDAKDNGRIQQKRVTRAPARRCPTRTSSRATRSARPLRGHHARGARALEPEKTRTIDIADFVDLDEIDPIFYDHPYYLVPDTGADKAYGCCSRRWGSGQGRRSPAW